MPLRPSHAATQPSPSLDAVDARRVGVPRARPTTLAQTALVHLALTSIVVAPFFSVAIPGLGDTLNHLARMHILATIGQSPDLQRFYEVHWAPIPYLAMDAVVPLLLPVLPIYLAGKLFVIACLLLPVAGTAALHYAVHRRVSLVPCAAYLFATNALLSLGFLNFLFSAGMALLLLAGWIAARAWPRWRRAAVFAPLVLLLYFGHVFACGAYCLSVCGVEVGRAVRARFRPRLLVLADMMAALAQAIPALVFAATLRVGDGYVGPLHTAYGSMSAKLFALFSPALFLHDAVNATVILGMLGLLAASVSRLRLSSELAPAGLLCGLVAVCVPNILDSTWGVDMRLPLFTVLLLIGSTSWRLGRAGPGALRYGVMAGAFGLVLAKSADSWQALHEVDGQIAETRTVLARLPRGARLLLVNTTGRGIGVERIPLSTAWHMPMVAVIDRDAFVPTLFSGLSTVHVRPEYRMSSTPNGLPITPSQLAAGAIETDSPGVERSNGNGGGRFYHFGWKQKFDYVLVQRFGTPAGPMPANLVLVVRAPDMDLYRIGSR